MKKRRAAALGAVALLALWLLAAPAAAQPPVMTDQDNGQAVTVKVGQNLTVNLRHPGDGGYNILPPQYDRAVLKLAGERRLPASEPRRMGDFGRIVYEFQALKEGQTSLVIPIQRPWEKESQTYFKITILVHP
jgi:predicted secreted protein